MPSHSSTTTTAPDHSDAKKRIAALYDANKDGALDDKELEKLRADYERGDATARELLHRFDRNRDGKLDKEELAMVRTEFSDLHMRYAAYLGAFARGIRYAAYTSDIGEAFRPIVHPRVVSAAYGISWLYVLGDVAYEGYDCKTNWGYGAGDLFSAVSKRAVFQSVASMALPAFTIHSAVKYSKKFIFKPYLPGYLKWGPTVTGLAVVPFLPVMWDHPVEWVCDKTWGLVLPLSEAAQARERAREHQHHH